MALGRKSIDGNIFSCTELFCPSHYKSHNCGMHFQNCSSGMDDFCLCLSSCDLGQVVGNSEVFKAVKIQRGKPERWKCWHQFLSMPLGKKKAFSTTASYQDCQPATCSTKMHPCNTSHILLVGIFSLNVGCSAQGCRKDHYSRLWLGKSYIRCIRIWDIFSICLSVIEVFL